MSKLLPSKANRRTSAGVSTPAKSALKKLIAPAKVIQSSDRHFRSSSR
ncbi:MAG: hypothetical protein M3Z29_11300 [Pseudomonadota bacterium]|nr:hypothetical protein [Pseudomonadota bacterium]